MLVPVEWLREYTDFDISVEELAERLTMAGLEVEEIREISGQQVYSTYVTPNRPDLLSITGVARDVSALLGASLRMPSPELEEGTERAADLVEVDIRSPVNCPRYSARVIKGVKVQQSPAWMQERLAAAGMRPINNVVDCTNFVLMELGQPLHAFDYDLVAGHKIIVRQAHPGEKLTTIDGEERTLSPDTLVIADAERAVAVAGVMGGGESEVSESTVNVLLESAHFNRLSIRRTARTLQMSTEASQRFERGVDPNLTVYALDRVARLIRETGGGTIASGVVDAYPVEIKPVELTIRPRRASMVMGFDMTAGQVAEYLSRLGMRVLGPEDDRIRALVPTFRPDIRREEDLIEEVGRIYGYDRIPEKLPSGESLQGKDSDIGAFSAGLSRILVSCGLEEVVTGSMGPVVEGEDQVAIRNPLSEDLSRMRASLLIDLLGVMSYNTSRGIRDIGIFQVGRVFEPYNGGGLIERLSVTGALTGSLWGPTWNVDRSALDADFFIAKGIVENLFERLGIENVVYKQAEITHFHPTRAASVEIAGEPVGTVGQVSPQTAGKYDVPERTYLFELDFNKLMEAAGRARGYVPVPRYPAVIRDLAVVVAGEAPFRRVEELIYSSGGDLLESAGLFDVYAGPPLQPGQKNLAFNIIFRSRERTLRDEEVDEQLGRIRSTLSAELGAVFRDV